MLRIITAVLAVGILTACNSGTTGSTASGEVMLEAFQHGKYFSKDTGEGYDFATKAKTTITPYTSNIDTIDIYVFPTRVESWDVTVRVSDLRIYYEGEWISVIYLPYDGSAIFEVKTSDNAARYRVFIQNNRIGYDPKRGGTVSENILRYELLDG